MRYPLRLRNHGRGWRPATARTWPLRVTAAVWALSVVAGMAAAALAVALGWRP
jgi:hypothetical protein